MNKLRAVYSMGFIIHCGKLISTAMSKLKAVYCMKFIIHCGKLSEIVRA